MYRVQTGWLLFLQLDGNLCMYHDGGKIYIYFLLHKNELAIVK